MSLDYSLALAGALSAESICNQLAQSGEFSMQKGELEAPGLYISILVPSGLSRQIIEEEFNFVPTLELDFRLDKFKDTDLAVRRILAGVAELLRATEADLSLLFNGEIVILTRIAGNLELYDSPEFWDAERLALMPEPRQRVPPRTL
jgi:hypothetical protein